MPKSVRRKARLKAGDQVEFVVSGRVINVVPKLGYANDTFNSEEAESIQKARREMRQGKYLTLAELHDGLVRTRSPKRRKATRSDSARPA